MMNLLALKITGFDVGNSKISFKVKFRELKAVNVVYWGFIDRLFFLTNFFNE